MLTKLLTKKRTPRLHRVLKEEDADRHHKLIPEVATDEAVRKLDHFERNAIHIAVRHGQINHQDATFVVFLTSCLIYF